MLFICINRNFPSVHLSILSYFLQASANGGIYWGPQACKRSVGFRLRKSEEKACIKAEEIWSTVDNDGGKESISGKKKNTSIIIYTGWVKKNVRRLKKLTSLNIILMTLKTISFFNSRYVQYGSIIYPAFIGHSFPSKWDIFCRKALSKTCKNEWKSLEIF